MRMTAVAAFMSMLLFAPSTMADTLERIRSSESLTIGYREDAAPYSYKNDQGEAAGYSVDLCRAIGIQIKDQLGLSEMAFKYETVTAENRFDAVSEGRIDILCGATTATLSRREQVDFSLPTFIDGASVMFRADGPKSFEALDGEKVGVRSGTTTEEALDNALGELGVDAEIVGVGDHEEGIEALQSGDIAAYFADQGILFFLLLNSPDPQGLKVSERFFTHEPYALALRRGDSAFRLAVDRGLSRIYRTGVIEEVFEKNLGQARPSDILKALYIISALPE